MGLLTIIRKHKAKDKEIRALILGLDNAGKTTIVKKILDEDIDIISPTMGFQIKTITYNDFTLNVWDVGGQSTLRTFWGNYYDKTDIVLWVIDCLSLERLQESYKELQEKVILQDRLVGVYLLVLINKVDLVLATESLENIKNEVIELLDLENQIPQLDKWSVELVSGRTGVGLKNVLDWVVTRDY